MPAVPPPAQQGSTLSPCIQVCRIDPMLKLCVGCGRTMDEIGRWSRLNDSQRLHVMDQLQARIEKLGPQRSALGLGSKGTDQ